MIARQLFAPSWLGAPGYCQGLLHLHFELGSNSGLSLMTLSLVGHVLQEPRHMCTMLRLVACCWAWQQG